MNSIVCTKLAIISVRNCIKGLFDHSDNKKGEGDIGCCLFCCKTPYSSITLFLYNIRKQGNAHAAVTVQMDDVPCLSHLHT